MNSSNVTYYPLEYWFEVFGYIESMEIVSTYIVLPIGLISFMLNSLTFIVLQKQSFLGSVFFSYMKLYIFNGAMLSLICSTYFITATHKILSFPNTYEALAYGIYFFVSVQPIFFLYSCFLEICVVIERSLYFLPKKFRKMLSIDFNKFALFLFLFCVILHIPSFFIFVPTYEDVLLEKNISYRIWYAGIADFSYTLTGKALTYIQYLIRDVLPLFIKIILNSMLVYLVKSYLNKLKKEKFANAIKVYNGRNGLISINIQSENYISKTDRNQTYISLIMCIFSIFEHIFYIASYITYFLNEFSDSTIFFCLASLFIAFKQMFNIIILYKFNSRFRTELKKFFNISK